MDPLYLLLQQLMLLHHHLDSYQQWRHSWEEELARTAYRAKMGSYFLQFVASPELILSIGFQVHQNRLERN